MGEIQKVSQGQPFATTADTWNSFVDAAIYVKQATAGGGGINRGIVCSPTTLPVKNNSGQTVKRFHALALGASIVDPNDSEDGVLQGIAFNGELPVDADAGRWGVLQQTLTDQTFGPVVASGFTICWINLQDAGDEFVEVAAGTDIPQSGASGLGQIMYVAGGVGSADDTGEQWAVIRLGGGGGAETNPHYDGMVRQGVGNNKAAWKMFGAHWPISPNP